MNLPTDCYYTNEHEWVKIDEAVAIIGITHHAQEQLGDVVFVELPSIGDQLQAKNVFGTVESVKAVSDIYAPISGDVTAVNEALLQTPELINSDPHGEGWIIKLQVFDSNEINALMDAKQYSEYVTAESNE